MNHTFLPVFSSTDFWLTMLLTNFLVILPQVIWKGHNSFRPQGVDNVAIVRERLSTQLSQTKEPRVEAVLGPLHGGVGNADDDTED